MSDLPTGKTQAIKDAGFTPKTAAQLEQLAANPDVVQAVLDKAEQEGRIPSRKQVLDAIHDRKIAEMEMEFESRDAAKIWIIKNQAEERRNLKPYDRSALVLKLEPLYAAEAKRRQATSTGGAHPQLSQKSDEAVTSARTDEQLAKLAGVSRDTIRKVKVIEQEAANGNQTAIDARDAIKSGEKSTTAIWVTPPCRRATQKAMQLSPSIYNFYVYISHFYAFPAWLTQSPSSPPPFPSGSQPARRGGGLQLVRSLIVTSVPVHPPQPPRDEAHEAEPRRPSRAGRAGRVGPTRQATAREERRTSEPMRQDRVRRTPHQSRATTERRQAAAEARQASSSRPVRVEHRQSIGNRFPRSTHPPITSSTTPSPSHIGARAGTQGNPSRATHIKRRQGRQTTRDSRPTAGAARATERATEGSVMDRWTSTRGSRQRAAGWRVSGLQWETEE